MSNTVVQASAELFRAHGMTTIFGNPGSNELPFHDTSVGRSFSSPLKNRLTRSSSPPSTAPASRSAAASARRVLDQLGGLTLLLDVLVATEAHDDLQVVRDVRGQATGLGRVERAIDVAGVQHNFEVTIRPTVRQARPGPAYPAGA